MDNSTLNVTSSTPNRLGWTGGTNDRGTIDIIWDCALTMFLCCWSILVVNVPKPGSSILQMLRQKTQLLCLCVLAPELIFQVAMGQFLSAKRATTEFQAAGHKEWSIRHSFYANMGALHLRSPDFKSFPINAKQLLYLIEHGYVDYPEINEDAIRDKNKIDGVLRAITAFQAMWFVANLLARFIQHLSVSCLELSTASWVIFCLGTTISWSKKPADVEVREFIDTKVSLAQILIEGGEKARNPYYYTPLDFVSRREDPWSRLWNHGMGYLRTWRLVPRGAERPIQQFGDTVTPMVDGWWHILFAFVTLCYFAVFIAAWNFSFPTDIERLLWRIAAIGGPVSIIAIYLAFEGYGSWYPLLKTKWHEYVSPEETIVALPEIDVEANEPETTSSGNLKKLEPTLETAKVTSISTDSSPSSRKANSRYASRRLLPRVLGYFRNNSSMKDPELAVPLRVIIVTWVFGLGYCLSRMYIVAEDFAELRSLPASAYQTVEWTKFWPHF